MGGVGIKIDCVARVAASFWYTVTIGAYRRQFRRVFVNNFFPLGSVIKSAHAFDERDFQAPAGQAMTLSSPR